MPSNSAKISLTPQNQIIYNTPWYNKRFSGIGVPVPDTPLDTIEQVVSKDELFKVPSSDAVYNAILNRFNQSVNKTDIIQEVLDGEYFKVPSSNAVFDALTKKIDVDKISQEIKDNVLDEIISSNVVYDKLNIFVYRFDIPAMEWIINHNMNTISFIESIMDDNNNKIFANINVIDNNSIKILFTEPVAGTANLRFGF